MPISPSPRNQMLFFCGNTPECLSFNSATALQRAKRVAEEEFSVVGVLERLEDTMEAMEAMAPRFFAGMRSLYQYQRKNGGKIAHTNKNPFKRPIPDDVRRELEEVAFHREMEFYRFCQQRLARQVAQVREDGDSDDNNASPFFDYEDMEPYKEEFEADDYVLLV